MDKHKALTRDQLDVLQAMAEGHIMNFSTDGEIAWLYPSHRFINKIPDDSRTIALIDGGYIERVYCEEDEDGWRDFYCRITAAGRSALYSPLGEG